MKKKILALCGISGTGKTTLRDKLVRNPEFYTMVQVTTRNKREGESPESYIFLTNSQYKYIEDKLVGKMQFHGNRYGTLMSSREDGIGVIILNEAGLKDFKEVFKDNKDTLTLVVGLDKDISKLDVKREGRDTKSLMQEKRVIGMCDEVLVLDEGQYATVDDIKALLVKYKML